MQISSFVTVQNIEFVFSGEQYKGVSLLSISSKGILVLNNVVIGDGLITNAVETDKSLINVEGGGMLMLSVVNVNKIKFVGDGLYGSIATVNFKDSPYDENTKLAAITGTLPTSSGIEYGETSHGEYYFIFTEEQITDNNVDEQRQSIKSKVDIVCTVDEDGKVYYRVGQSGLVSDLVIPSGSYYLEDAQNSKSCTYAVPCDMGKVIQEANKESSNSATIVIQKDDVLSNSDAVYGFDTLTVQYIITKSEAEIITNTPRTITLGITGDKASKGLSATKSLTINQVNIIIANLNGNAFIQTSETLEIKEKDENNLVIIGGKQTPAVDITDSLIKVSAGAKLKLSNVQIQNVKTAADINGGGFYLDAIQVQLKVQTLVK